MKKNTLQIEKRIELENKIKNFKNSPNIDVSDDMKMAESLKLKVEYCNLGPKTEAELCPPTLNDCLGIVRVDERYKGTRFALTHEIIHYIIDVGIGNKVEEVYTRNTKGNTKNEHEQEINYATAAFILDYNEIKDIIIKYDTTKPKMDELRLVHDLCEKYSQTRTTVIRRIQEVRALMSYNYATS